MVLFSSCVVGYLFRVCFFSFWLMVSFGAGVRSRDGLWNSRPAGRSSSTHPASLRTPPGRSLISTNLRVPPGPRFLARAGRFPRCPVPTVRRDGEDALEEQGSPGAPFSCLQPRFPSRSFPALHSPPRWGDAPERPGLGGVHGQPPGSLREERAPSPFSVINFSLTPRVSSKRHMVLKD